MASIDIISEIAGIPNKSTIRYNINDTMGDVIRAALNDKNKDPENYQLCIRNTKFSNDLQFSDLPIAAPSFLVLRDRD